MIPSWLERPNRLGRLLTVIFFCFGLSSHRSELHSLRFCIRNTLRVLPLATRNLLTRFTLLQLEYFLNRFPLLHEVLVLDNVYTSKRINNRTFSDLEFLPSLSFYFNTKEILGLRSAILVHRNLTEF
jgi:hypothetical protein